MSSVLARMVQRSRGPLSAVEPLIPPRYAAAPGTADFGVEPDGPPAGSDIAWGGPPREAPGAVAPRGSVLAPIPAASGGPAPRGVRLDQSAARAAGISPGPALRRAGPSGPPGPAGAVGGDGPPGAAGATGAAGASGAVGADGPVGPAGPGLPSVELPATWVRDTGPATLSPRPAPEGSRSELPGGAADDDAPALTITIGHIEVRAASESRPRPERARPDPPHRQPFRPQVTLAEFLGRDSPRQGPRR